MALPWPLTRLAALAAYICRAVSVLLILIWLLVYCGGFSVDERLVFNFHPLLMAVAWLVCTTQGTALARLRSTIFSSVARVTSLWLTVILFDLPSSSCQLCWRTACCRCRTTPPSCTTPRSIHAHWCSWAWP